MLSEVRADGTLVWICPGGEEDDDKPCGIENTASLDEVVYHEAPDMRVLGRGATIALPKCACKTQTFLKADWSLKELYRVLVAFLDEQGDVWAYALRFEHVYSLQLHWMLYQQGRAAYPPIVDMPPQAVMEHSQFEGVDPRVTTALWCGFTIVRQLRPELLKGSHLFAQIAGPIS